MMSREWITLPEAVKATIAAHQNEVPIRLSAVANALGVAVRASTLPAGISGEIRPDPERQGAFVIRVNRHDAERRQRFTVAHEIGHFLLHRDQIGRGIRDDVLYRSMLSDRREAEANRLAADILMPETLIGGWVERARLLQAQDVVGYLSDRFNVSEAAMKIRLGLK